MKRSLTREQRQKPFRPAAEMDDPLWCATRLGANRNERGTQRFRQDHLRIASWPAGDRAELVATDQHVGRGDFVFGSELTQEPPDGIAFVGQTYLDVFHVARDAGPLELPLRDPFRDR